MSEKEKAKELVDRFKDLSIVTDYNCNDHKEVAKQCAIICQDRVISELENIQFNYDLDLSPVIESEQRVKNEINKI